jgi:BolA protein
MSVAATLHARLTEALSPERIELVDQSARHAGHAAARPGGESHFDLLIVAEAFVGRSRLERQRMVHAALAGLIGGQVHALSITALAPAETTGRMR